MACTDHLVVSKLTQIHELLLFTKQKRACPKFLKLKGKVSLSLQTTSYWEENPNHFVSFTVPPLHAVLKIRTLHNSGCLCHFQQNKDNLLIIQTNLMPVMFIQTSDQKEQDQEAIQQKHLRQGYLAN
jgi:hypothetical protein